MDFVPNHLGLEVLTPTGYRRFAGIADMGERPTLRLTFGNGRSLTCSEKHRLICPTTGATRANELVEGDWVLRADGRRTRVKSIETAGSQRVFDLVEVDGNHTYMTEDVVSHNCEFITADETLIDPTLLTRLKHREPIFYTGKVRWYEDVLPNKGYLIGLDPSLGTGGDYSAIQVFSLPDMTQVAEWQHNRTNPREQVVRLMQILTFIDATLREHPDQLSEPEIYWTVENNSIGETILMTIEDTGEDRFPGEFLSEKRKKGRTRRFRKGLNTTNTSKRAACARLKSLMETGRMEVRSEPLLRQLKNFIARGAGFAAKQGEHDDLVTSILLVVRMLDRVLNWLEDADELREYISESDLYGEDDDDAEGMPIVI